MRDGLLDLPSLGQAAGVCNRSVKVRYICLPIYHNRWSEIRQAPESFRISLGSEGGFFRSEIIIARMNLV